MDLLDAIAAAVPPTAPPGHPETRYRSAFATASAKPVLQFGLAPVALDLKKYADARSNSRPDGDLRALVAFRDLVDPLPTFTRFYASSGVSTERRYESILEGATLAADNPFALHLLDDAKQQFEASTFPNMDGTSGRWRPVYAVPEDWHDLSIDGRFQDLSIDLADPDGRGSAYAMIGDPAPLGLRVDGPAPTMKPADPATTVRSLRMKYLLVSFNRPWFRYELFQTGGWWLSQQPTGYCSSGEIHDNPGVFPLLPTGMLLGKDVALDVTWGKTDQALLSAASPPRLRVSLGPFRVDLSAPATDVQIVAWTSALLPLSPRTSDLPGP